MEEDTLTMPLYRANQIDRLRLLLGGGPEVSVAPLLFINGLGAAGKTLVTKWVLASEGITHAVFHCVELYNIRFMLESIIKQLVGEHRKCENVQEFVSILKKELGTRQVFAILFEEAERFRDASPHLSQVFTRLQELTGLNIVCIWESRIDWSRFLPSRSLPSPVVIYFPQYTKSELTNLMVAEPPGDMSNDFKADYVEVVLSIFHLVARSLAELSHIAQLHYKEYCRPVVEGEVKPDDGKKLFYNIEKSLTKCLSTGRLREVASNQMKELNQAKEEHEKADSGPMSTAVVDTSRTSVELPFYSKFLLISAYLASYNPQKTDKRFFTKHHGKQRKTASSIKAKEKFNSQLTGPKPFPLERMLAIFYNIIEETVNPTANIYSQITSLVRLQLISGVGHDMIEQPKYKCNVTLEFIKNVSNTLQFDIQKYIY